ncbi:MAG: hypothetical protein AAF849_11435 [Bacteroidota bacterium]
MRPTNKKIIFVLGSLTYLVLALTALYFYKERTAYMDVAFRIFHILSEGKLAIQAGRFGEALTQWIPLLGAHFDLSIPQIARAYSVGIVGYYYVLFLICYFVLKQPKFSLLLVLSNVFIVSYTFWWMQIEFAQAIALSIVFMAWMTKEQKLKNFFSWKAIPLLLLFHTLFYFHPLLSIVLVFFICFFYLQQLHGIEAKLATALVVLLLAEYLVRWLFLGSSNYDSNAMKGLDNFSKRFPNYFDLPANHNFFEYCLTDYYLLPIALLLMLLLYWQAKRRRLFWLVFGFFFGYLLLVNVSNYKGMDQFHIESFYLPLSIFVLCPLVFNWFPSIKSTRGFALILASILLLRVYHIYQLHPNYAARVNYYENLITKVQTWEHQKVVLPKDAVPMDTLWQVWASAQEI